ncbi:Membrane-associated guanylate kinase, WW and PDZ domain-containing protein 1, partial [Stegodyphus mimosarum]
MDPYCVTISRKGKENFGIVLKSTSQGIGSILERVVKGSAADQCCECRIGDRLLAVNNLNVLYLDVRIAAFFIETSGNSVTLMFWPSERGASDTPVSMQWEESLVNVELHLELSIAGGSKNMPLFIRGIAFPEYMKKGKLLVGDIITEIKPKTAEIVTLASGVKLLKGHVTLRVKRRRCRELTSSVYSGRTMHRTYPYSITVSR